MVLPRRSCPSTLKIFLIGDLTSIPPHEADSDSTCWAPDLYTRIHQCFLKREGKKAEEHDIQQIFAAAQNRLLGLSSVRQGPGHGTRCAARLEVVKEMHILEDQVGPDRCLCRRFTMVCLRVCWFAGLLRIPNQLLSMEP